MTNLLYRIALLLAVTLAAVDLPAADYLEPGNKPVKVASGCKFTEGPAVDSQGNVFFSDGPNDRIMQIAADGKVSIFRQPCGRANGMEFDNEGRLVMCQSAGATGKRRVARLETDGSEVVLADTFEGKQFNAPNDLTIDRKGRIYFTDMAPPTEKNPTMPPAVYRIDGPGKVVKVIDNLLRPNGIVITPDNKTLYVSDRGVQKLQRYKVAEDGSLKPDGTVYDFSPDRGIDGMCIDIKGNLYTTAGKGKTSGVYIFSPEGKKLDVIPVPETPTNCVFGGADRKMLYVTAGRSLYRVQLTIEGFAVYWPK